MKKGDLIRIEIKEAREDGLLLYSYKKKADVFVAVSSLKSNYSPKKYSKLVGTPIVLRIVSSRPDLILSEKYMQENNTVFDDFALKPVNKDTHIVLEEKSIEKEEKVISMIENKKIIITKENTFDKGWTLFHPFDLNINRNRLFKETMISDVIRLITHSNEVNLILSDSCLSSRIVNEIEWANKYIKLNIIAKDDSIINNYRKFSFNSKKVDSSIDFSYIGIIGKENGHFMISDGYTEIDDSLYKVYFQNKNLKGDYSFLNNASKLIIIDCDGKKDYSMVISAASQNKIPCYYAVNTRYFNNRIFNYSKENKIELLVSEYTQNGIIVVNRDNTLSCVTMTNNGFYLSYPIENISSFLGMEYKSGYYKDSIETDKLKGEIYSCYNGRIEKLNIIDKKIVPLNVDVELMSDFVSETFDSSIVEKHNDYSAEAKKVEYQFNLIPPLFDSKYVESNIYDGIHELHSKWNNQQTLKIKRIKDDYNTFIDEDYGLIDFLLETEKFTKEFDERVEKCDYKNYYCWIKSVSDQFNKNRTSLLDICKNMFNSINEESSGTKFDKFDNEIAGYEQTIKEKNALIQKGIDVLSNKRRVEILTKKINDLLELKKHFESNSSSRNDKNLNAFIKRCEELLDGKHRVFNDDSIGNIVKPKEETKLAKLEAFVDNYLLSIRKYDDECLSTIDKLSNESIPEDYAVYDKKGQRYIIINDLQEYETTKHICDKFKLRCITRR
ncbi:MAG: hypothetical protein PUG14_05655 [Acholeplasmatales bacterium]|nr:hypothetical protein [Acholeplasmatales bacterium]MDD7395530.1 hypothetical protein [Acholeplasmatales bacterium]MDY4052776.1 hypothetical protein [Bacilli bacterium]